MGGRFCSALAGRLMHGDDRSQPEAAARQAFPAGLPLLADRGHSGPGYRATASSLYQI